MIKIKASLSYRLVPLYRILSFIKFYFYNRKNVSFTNRYEFRLICGKGQLNMLRYSLISFLKSNQKVPILTIFSDGSITIEDLPNIVYKFNNFRFISYENLLAENREQTYLLKNLNSPGMKKYLSLFFPSKCKNVILADPDILWLQPLLPFFSELQKSNITICYDYMHSYDNEFIIKFNWNDLTSKPPLNCGVVFLKNRTVDGIEFAEKTLKNSTIKGNYFLEQTLLARLVVNLNSQIIPKTKILCTAKDAYELLPSSKYYTDLIARHYVNTIRHLFWRDLFWKI